MGPHRRAGAWVWRAPLRGLGTWSVKVRSARTPPSSSRTSGGSRRWTPTAASSA